MPVEMVTCATAAMIIEEEEGQHDIHSPGWFRSGIRSFRQH